MADTPADSFDLRRLIKFMGLTGSSNDGEALAALRMANRECSKIGKSWSEILSGKVTVVADPFASMPEPPTREAVRPPRTSPPPAPPPHRPTGFRAVVITNNHFGYCLDCNTAVDRGQGHAIKLAIGGHFQVFCHSCAVIGGYVANSRPQTPPPQHPNPPRPTASNPSFGTHQSRTRAKRKPTPKSVFDFIDKSMET